MRHVLKHAFCASGAKRSIIRRMVITMKNTMKKILAAVLCAAVLLSSLPVSVFAEELKTPEPYELADDYISVTVSAENGGFLINTVEGNRLEKEDNNQNLLYPSAEYDTSYTSIRVTRTDGSVEDYIFGRNYGFLGLSSSEVEVAQVGNTLEAVWSVKDITVKQTLGLLDEASSQHGMVSIDYAITTTADDVENVKIRVMLDTALGSTDTAYYQIPNVLNEYASLTNEYLLDNTDSYTAYNGAFFAVDDPASPKINAYTIDVAVDGRILKPYQVAFGHWNSLASTVFDFTPNPDINFTTAYNEEYRTADSAYALYYDLGALTAEKESRISTYYGVFSNSTVSSEESVAINLSAIPAAMTMTEDKSAYVSQVEGGKNGDVKLQLLVENLTDETIDSMMLVVKTMNNVTPYIDWQFDEMYQQDANFQETRYDFVVGEELAYDIFFNVTPLPASEYRRFEILCYDTSDTQELTEANCLGSREFYLFCPGVLGEVVAFNTISPQIIHYEGTRRLFISGQNIGLLQDTTAYTTILRSTVGAGDVIIPSQNVAVDTTNNSMYITINTEMVPGSYQVVFDWNEAGKEDTTAAALQFMVSDKPEYVAPTYGIVTIEKAKDFTEDNPKYTVGMYESEAAYKASVSDPQNTVYLEFRGNFGANYDTDGNLIELKAASMADARGKITNTINISNCLDVEDGFVSINIENPGLENQCINIDIDGKVYTTNARSKVWDGVCAITSFENGDLCTLMQYKQDGTEADNIDSVTANTNLIMLLWPGAASEAQTLAGMIFEFRYCYFGMIATEPGTVTSSTPKHRVISFGAQLSPNFLLPRNFDWGARETSPMEAVQLKMAKSNYTADQLRDVEARYARDQRNWRESQKGSMNLYVDNILFGGGFVGFVSSIDVSLPSYAEGLPGIGGTLDLHIMPALDYWKVGVAGVADFVAIKFEAAITLKKAYGEIPGLDKLYLYVEGDMPGINVDGMGIFWIQGLGGGIDNLYDTICMASDVPPISLLLSGKFALFSVLSARADLELSLRGFEVDISELGIKDITLIDNLGLEVRWYPALFLRGDIAINILGIIDGGGYIVLEESLEDGSIFWEAFATAGLMIPDYVPVIGGYEVGRASLGVNCNKMWGAMAVIGIDFGVTYYWGGDVDFAMGKYDAPEPTYPLRTAAVAHHAQAGRTLYMAVGTNAMLRVNNMGVTRSEEYAIDSSVDRMTHTISLGGYDASRDTMLTMTYQAATREEAEQIAKRSLQIAAVDDESISYQLNWLDPDRYADEQDDANAIFSYDETTNEAMVTVSFTEEASYAHDWKITMDASAEVAIYEMQRMANVDSASYVYDAAGSSMTVNWTGYELSDIDKINVYAVAQDGTSHHLHQTSDVTAGSAAFDLPASLPSGTYTVQIVASSEANNINSMVSADSSFNHVNPFQPTAPTVDRVALGGDYSIDVDLTAGQNTDGYVITVEEKITHNGQTSWVSTELGSQWIEQPDGSTITVGGQYETVAYVDAEGNAVSSEEAEGRNDVTATTQIMGLEAGKTYRLRITAYHEEDDVLFSEVTYSEEITMVAPAKPSVTVSAAGSIAVNGVNYVNVTEVTFQIDSDMPISGNWSLDDGAQKGSFAADTQTVLTIGGLSEGQHTLTLTGANRQGDAFAVDYVFCVKATAPRLQIATPDGGAFFQQTVSVAGLSEPGAKIYVLLDEEEVSTLAVDGTGAFSVSVPMDLTKFEQTVSVYAEDAIGNVSRQYDFKLTNAMVAAPDAKIAIFLDGTDYTNTVIPAGTSGTMELRIVSGGQSLVVPASSVLGSQAEWSLEIVSGSARISGNQLTTDSEVNGMLKVSFEGHDVAAVLGGNKAEDPITCNITLPAVQYGYQISPLTSTSVTYGASFLFELKVEAGYSKTARFAVKVNGVEIEPDASGVYVIAQVFEDKTITVEGIADVTDPRITLSVGALKWMTFDGSAAFDTYFNQTQSVSISARDGGSGIFAVYYIISENPLTLQQLRALPHSGWTRYTETFELSPNRNCIIYAQAVDFDGNTAYCSSSGIVLKDSVSIPGIEDGKTYEGDLTVTVDDPYMDYVKLDGVSVELTDVSFTIEADSKHHTVEIADKAGNTATYNITVMCVDHTGGTASCTEEGKCAACGEAYLPMTEHETELRGSKEATVDSEGYTGDTVCKNCNTVIAKGQVIPKLADPVPDTCVNHTGGTASCTEEGKCTVCGEAYLPMTEHETELRGAKEATVDSEGYTGDTVCKNCDTVIAKGQSVPKLADSKFTGGAIATIVIGVVAVAALGGFAIFWFVIKKRKWSDLFHR